MKFASKDLQENHVRWIKKSVQELIERRRITEQTYIGSYFDGQLEEIHDAYLSNVMEKKYGNKIDRRKEYYNIIRELMSVILLLDGYKTFGENAHKNLINYIQENYKEIEGYEISLINELRITRNKIAYDGFFVEQSYIRRKLEDIRTIIKKLRRIILYKKISKP